MTVCFEHIKDTIFSVLVVVTTGYGIFKVLFNILDNICCHGKASISALVDLDQILRELNTFILKS